MTDGLSDKLNQIICGDNCDVLGTLPRGCIDLVVTSPPYDNLRTYGGHSWDFYGVAWQLKRVLKPGGVIVWVVNDATINGSETGTSFRQALHFKELGLNLHDTMIYKQAGTGAKGSNLAYWQSYEFMFVFANGSPASVNRLRDKRNVTAGSVNGFTPKSGVIGTRKTTGVRIVGELGIRENVWTYAAHYGESTSHPAPFPEPLARDHILSWSNEGDIVLDPFVGSGTTAKMAMETGRQFIGIDVHEPYCEIARKRLANCSRPLLEAVK